jgi:hypothetical protein
MRTGSPLPFFALCAVSSVSMGCSANLAGPDAVDADSTSPASAVVVVERVVGAGDAQASAVARFVRMRSGAVDEDALRMVGATVDFPALGTCATAAALKRPGTARAADLLDVGAMSLEANGVRTSLQTRQLPDVVDLLSGVVYATPAGNEAALPQSAVYVLRAAGAADLDVAPFAVTASAPAEPTTVRIGGQDTAEAAAITLAAGSSVEVTWEAGTPEDLVYFDVGGEPEPTAVRCLFTDSGRATLSSAAFADSWTTGTIAIHRLHREPFRVKGIESGEVRFDFARVVTFTRL